MLVPSLTVAPLLWLGVHQLLAYNLLLLSGFALSGAAMFLLVRSLTQHTGAALVAGFVFAFLPYRYMHYAHLELQMAQWMPLCLWALHRTISAGRIRDGLLTGLFLALQTLSSFYYGIFFATYLVPVGIALLDSGRVAPILAGRASAGQRRRACSRPRRAVRAARISPRGSRWANGRSPRSSSTARRRRTTSSRIRATPLFGPFSTGMGSQERELFEGFVVPALARRCAVAADLGGAHGLRRRPRAGVRALARHQRTSCTRGCASTSLPFRGLRVPARMAILVGLSLAILVGYAVARISRAGSSPRRPLSRRSP